MLAQTGAGRFIVKLHGAAQGPAALVAEIIVAELAEALGLPVPERALLELVAPIETDDRNDELADLLQRSLGLNLGFRWLPDAELLDARRAASLDEDFRVRVAWLDGFVQNLDRTTHNPNIVLSKGQPWLIDHGAALPFQHDFRSVTEDSPREPYRFDVHVFAACAPLLPRVDPSLAEHLSREVLERCVGEVPAAFLAHRPREWSVERARAAYVAFLWKRLRAPRPFVG